jgi:hypothetical protein
MADQALRCATHFPRGAGIHFEQGFDFASDGALVASEPSRFRRVEITRRGCLKGIDTPDDLGGLELGDCIHSLFPAARWLAVNFQ